MAIGAEHISDRDLCRASAAYRRTRDASELK
jgi:hypothetical protein